VRHIILNNEKEGTFRVERAYFMDAKNEWLLLDGPDDLPKLFRKYCQYLEKDSFYDLIW
jgi:hypothetical protein